MPRARKIRRDVVLDRDAASGLIRGIAQGLSDEELVLHGQDGSVMMTPGAEIQIRIVGVAASPRLDVRLSWERLRSLRERPAPTLATPAGAAAPAKGPASSRRPTTPRRKR